MPEEILEEVETEILTSHNPVKLLKANFLIAFLLSAGCLGVIGMARSQGFLQGAELKAYDSFVNWQPRKQGLDEHILIVEITKDDLKEKEKSITNQQLADLLSKLQQHRPRVIGLDVHRNEDDKVIKKYLEEKNVISTCLATMGKPSSAQEYAALPYKGVPEHQLGFANLPRDEDEVYRRQLLTLPVAPSATCNTRFSLSFQIALSYLEKDGISPDTGIGDQIKLISNKESRNAPVLIQQLQESSGVYQKQEIPGYQILLNYRSRNLDGESFRRVTLSDITENRFDQGWINDKIVLIGYRLEDPNESPDNGLIPYSFSQSPSKQSPGVVIHAYGVSQIIDVATGKRQLLKVLPLWIEFIWLSMWVLTTDLLILCVWRPLHLFILAGVEIVVITGFSILLFNSFWLPFIPSILVVVFSHFTVAVYLNKKQNWDN